MCYCQDGGLFTFGSSSFGQLGHNATPSHSTTYPTKVFELMGSTVTQVACGRWGRREGRGGREGGREVQLVFIREYTVNDLVWLGVSLFSDGPVFLEVVQKAPVFGYGVWQHACSFLYLCVWLSIMQYGLGTPKSHLSLSWIGRVSGLPRIRWTWVGCQGRSFSDGWSHFLFDSQAL